MTTGMIVLVGVAILVVLNVVLWFLFGRRAGDRDGDEKERDTQLILQQLNDFRRDVDARLGESSKAVHESLKTQLSESSRFAERAQKTQSELVQQITELKETNKQVVSFADQLQHMQDILQNPKQRGVLGEFFLETVLRDVLPEGTYQTQYAFKNGEAVDAIVRVREHIVPVDAKFSLENYNRMVEQRDKTERERLEKQFVNDLKLRIKETSKYIRPEEGTTDFAFMFIPSEGIYYDLLSNKVGLIRGEENNLIQRAYKEYKVIVVSPTTFVAYLQTVLQGLKSLKIEEQARDIQKRVIELGKHLKTYEEYHAKLGNTLSTAVNHYNRSGNEFLKLDKDVLRITGESPELETAVLDRPQD